MRRPSLKRLWLFWRGHCCTKPCEDLDGHTFGYGCLLRAPWDH